MRARARARARARERARVFADLNFRRLNICMLGLYALRAIYVGIGEPNVHYYYC